MFADLVCENLQFKKQGGCEFLELFFGDQAIFQTILKFVEVVFNLFHLFSHRLSFKCFIDTTLTFFARKGKGISEKKKRLEMPS